MLDLPTESSIPDRQPMPPPLDHTTRSVGTSPRRALLRRRTESDVTLNRVLARGLERAIDDPDQIWASARMELVDAVTASELRRDCFDPAALGLMTASGPIGIDGAGLISLLSGIPLPPRLDPQTDDLFRLALARIPPCVSEVLGGPSLLAGSASSALERSVRLRLIACGGESHAFLLSASSETLLRWTAERAWRRPHVPSPGERVGKVTLPGGWWLGRQTLPQERLNTLRAGDALWLPGPLTNASSLHLLSIGGRLLKTGAMSGASCVFEGWGSLGGAGSNANHASRSSRRPPMDTLTVDLDFIAGRLSLTINELCELQVGSVLALDTLMPAQVRIVAHGTQLGAGELIDVDGRLAVEILDWDATR